MKKRKMKNRNSPIKRCEYSGEIVNGRPVVLLKYVYDYVKAQGYDIIKFEFPFVS